MDDLRQLVIFCCCCCFHRLDSSDEEELFCKDNPVTSSRGARAQAIPASKGGHKGKLRALSEKSPNMTHADWAMENMCRTPGEITMTALCYTL